MRRGKITNHMDRHHNHSHAGEHYHAHLKYGETVLTVRAHSGLSGDMLVAGLMRVAGPSDEEIDRLLAAILPELTGTLRLTKRKVNQVTGWTATVALPEEHQHRSLRDICTVISQSGLTDQAKQLATDAFTLLARAEAAVHDKNPEEVHFHEVGALDSILDICLAAELFTRLAPGRFVVSPLPLADGHVTCAHGVLPVPAPAVLELLEGVSVCRFPGNGETITPTAIALLRAFGAIFGGWPDMRVERRALVYGSHDFPSAPNGAIFAFGPTKQ